MVGISPRDRGNIGDTANILPDSTAKGARPGQEVPKAMDKEGAVGKQFTGESPGKCLLSVRCCVANGPIEQGALGGAAQKVGGPFDKEGMIGKQFTDKGAIGGTVQDTMGGTKEKKM